MNADFVLRLRQPASVVEDGSSVSVRLWSCTLVFPTCAPALRAALVRLERGATAGVLSRMVDEAAPTALARWHYCLFSIERRGGLVYEVRSGSRLIARAIGTTDDFRPGVGTASIAWQWVLSRFAFLRGGDTSTVLESPISGALIEVHDAHLLSLLGALNEPTWVPDALARVNARRGPIARTFLGLLEYCGAITRVGGGATEAAATWALPDLLLHRRSRSAWNDRFDARDVPPVERVSDARPTIDGKTVDLPAPPLSSANDQTFMSVLERRASIRVYDETPLTVDHLAEFLCRSVGVVQGAHGAKPNYPAAGGIYELETYVAIAQCGGLAPGLYHYDASTHRLVVAADDSSGVAQLLNDAARGADGVSPQVLIILAARFGGLMSAYGAGSYALVLKDVGVVMQTMYLVATALGLAPCAIGSGNSAQFSRLITRNQYDETSVGELLLGSRARIP